MKLLIQSICAIVISCLLVASVQAGVRDVGNPGKGVFVGDKLLLLDLYEVGVLNPVIDESLVPTSVYLERAQRLSFLSPREMTLLAIKLSEVRAQSPKLADSMALAMNLYVWRMLDQELIDVQEPSPVQLPSKSVLLANRLGGIIRLSTEAWKLLDSENRVALVLHEVMMALSPSIFNRSVAAATDRFRVRQIVGYLFLPEFKLRGADGFAIFSGVIPVISKITGENILLVALDALAVDVPTAGRTYFDFPGPQFTESKNVFCRNLHKEANDGIKVPLKFLFRTQTVVYKFQVYESEDGYQNGLEEESSKSNMAVEVPLEEYGFYQDKAPQCRDLIDQELAKVNKLFSY